MSLTYDLWSIPDMRTVCYDADDQMRPATHAIILAMMGMGLKGVITPKNADEAVQQFAAAQRLNGSFLLDEAGAPLYITEADIRAHVGLTTNAFGPENTPAAFWRRMAKRLAETSVGWVASQAPSVAAPVSAPTSHVGC